jgi:MFS family permease
MEPIVKKIILIWIAILAVTTCIMLYILLLGEFSLTSTLIVFLVVIKFLAGFGLPMGLSTAIIFVLTHFEKWFSGEENRANVRRLLIFIVFVLIIVLIYQGPYKIITSILNPGVNENILDIILYVYGIASLFITMYIWPLLKAKFFVYKTIGEKDVLKKSVTQTIQGIKTRFQSWRKQYAKVEIQKQVDLKDQLNEVRRQIAIFTFIFLGIGCLIFMPLTAIFIFIWLRIYLIFTSERPLKFEIFLLIGACIVIMIIALLEPFIPPITAMFGLIFSNYYYWVFIAQFIGLLISSLIYINHLLRPILEERKKRKMEELKQESEDLKKQRGELQQSQKDLLKEKKKLEKEIKKTKQ